MEFECVKNSIDQVTVDIVSADDHESAVKRSIQTVKDCMRYMIEKMSYRCMPLQIVKRLVKVSITNLNQLPVKHSVSKSHRLLTIVTRGPLPEHAKFNAYFGDHAEMFEDNTMLSNINKPRDFPETCIRQKPNRNPDQCFMSSILGRMVRRNQCTELPVPDEATEIVNEMDRKQVQHWMHDREPIISTRRESDITDMMIKHSHEGALTYDGETDYQEVCQCKCKS